MKFRVSATRTTSDLTMLQLLAVRDVFNVSGTTERRTWEFEAKDEAEVRSFFKAAQDEGHASVRGFAIEKVEALP